MEEPDEKRMLIDLEHQRCAALVRRDVSELNRILSDDIVHVHTNGTIDNKAELIRKCVHEILFVALERRDLRVRLFENTAVMTGVVINNLRQVGEGRPFEVMAFATQTWVKRNGNWQCVSFSAVNLETFPTIRS